MNLSALARRQSKLCSRLVKFSVRHVVQILAGLLTQPDNHSATLRIEALIHLAVIYCKGSQIPSLPQMRQWLNDILLKDVQAGVEDPNEDVFCSVVPSSGGSILVLEGAREGNVYHLQRMLSALLNLRGKAWGAQAFHHVMALLRLANAMAEKSGAARYTVSSSGPRHRVLVTPRNTDAGVAAVNFTLDDVVRLGLSARDLAPFVMSAENTADLEREELGQTSIERYPLIRHDGGWLVTLPTAISAAARLFVLECAASAHVIPDLEAAIRNAELQDALVLLLPNLGITQHSDPEVIDPQITVIRGRFDLDSYALLVLVSEDLSDATATGIERLRANLTDRVRHGITPIEAELARSPGFRRGLTLVAHGGIAASLHGGPAQWYRLALGLDDALLMSWDADFDAKRLWKLQSQGAQLHVQGVHVANFAGFMNLYGYLESQRFDALPAEMSSQGMIMLAPGYSANVRHRVRSALDYHLILDPSGRNYAEVQRRSTSSFFEETSRLPLYIAPFEALNGRLLAVVELPERPWWVEFTVVAGGERNMSSKIWDAAQRWLLRLAPILETDLAGLSDRPVCFRLEFPDDLSTLDAAMVDHPPPERPGWFLVDSAIVIRSSIETLRGYVDATNIAERQLIAAMALGAAALAGAERTMEWADELADRITMSTDARFVHAIPATDVTELLQWTMTLPPVRLVAEEDRAWAHFQLATLAGRGMAGEVSAPETGALLQAAVLRVWERLKTKLERIDRRSLVIRAVLNHEAIDRDRKEWSQTAAALRSLHTDLTDVRRVYNEAELKRGAAGVASRALAEMAICTSPTSGGLACTDIDFDDLMGDVAAMLDCASQCDAYHYGLARAPLQVAENGNFMFDLEFEQEMHMPYMHAHGDRAFQDAAEAYADSFEPAVGEGEPPLPPPEIDLDLRKAVRAEFGMDLEQLVELSHATAEEALDAEEPLLCMRKSKLLELFESLGGGIDAERAFYAFTLRPRPEWNERNPDGALARDWQPWRMNRKLSLTRRPFIQITENDDSEILISPALTSRVIRRFFELIDGRLGTEMFDSKEVDRWIGKVVNERGHAFNHSVAARLREIGFEVLSDQLMTKFGATKDFGDIDVLAWNRNSNEVWAIECKRLLLDRTVGEIGERLADYTTRGTRHKKRTPIQKHLDRVEFLRANIGPLASLTRIPNNQILLKSALITDRIVPMQFTKKMTSLVDRTCDYRSIEQVFGSAT